MISDKNANQIIGEQITDNVGTLLDAARPGLSTPACIRSEHDHRPARQVSLHRELQLEHGVRRSRSTTADGSLGGTAAGSYSTATAPTCVTIEDSVGIYLFSSNKLDNSISGAQLSPNTGELKAIANTPFPSAPQPACLTSVANGSHAQSIVNPN